MKKKISILILLLFSFTFSFGQSRSVLFLGNSYTQNNNLPQMIADVASSVNDTLIHDNNTPGGYYLGQHLTNTVSLNKIMNGNWDYVVLQDQSTSYAYPPPYFYGMSSAYNLDSIIKIYNNCEQTIFYATWGRKNGDQYICTPPACLTNTTIVRTYYQMDSAIQTNYMFVADSLNAQVSPVGAVWRYIRRNYPTIELFAPDDSHPSLAGTYAAACCFYATIFRKNPTTITFNSSLSATDAANIRYAAKMVVYNQLLNWHIGEYDNLLPSTCSSVGIKENSLNTLLNFYPNPIAERFIVEYTGKKNKVQIEIYNAIGILIKEMELTTSLQINVANLPSGLYFIRLKNHPQQALKIIKQ